MEIVQALILDMDGILIDSEPLWRRAMISGFKEFNIFLSEYDCRLTVGKRIDQVIDIWVKRTKNLTDPKVIETVIVNNLNTLLKAEGKAMDGAYDALVLARDKGFKTGLATSSSYQLMETVLEITKTGHLFDCTISAEHLEYAKPHPMVFLKCATTIGVKPAHCMVVEDSINGIIAGKAAGMKVVGVPDPHALQKDKFAIADILLDNMSELPNFIKAQRAYHH